MQPPLSNIFAIRPIHSKGGHIFTQKQESNEQPALLEMLYQLSRKIDSLQHQQRLKISLLQENRLLRENSNSLERKCEELKNELSNFEGIQPKELLQKEKFIAFLRKENVELHWKIQSIEDCQRIEHKKEVDSSIQQLAEYKKQCQLLQRKTQIYKEQIDSTSKWKASMQKDKKQADYMIDWLKGQLEKHKLNQKAIAGQLQAKHAQIRKKQQQIDGQIAYHKMQEQNIRANQKQTIEIKRQLQKQRKANSQLQDQLSKRSSISMKQKLKFQQELATLKTKLQLAHAQKQNNLLTRSQKDKQSQSKLQMQNKTLREQITTQCSQLKQLQKINYNLRTEIATLKHKNEQLDSENNGTLKSQACLIEQLSGTKSMASQLNRHISKVRELQSQLLQQRLQNDTLLAKLQKVGANVDSRALVDQLRAKYVTQSNMYKQEIRQLEGQLKTLRSEKESIAQSQPIKTGYEAGMTVTQDIGYCKDQSQTDCEYKKSRSDMARKLALQYSKRV